MKKFLLLGTMLCVATSAFALGGFFGGHKSHNYSGVDAVGVHYNGDDKKPDINIRTCDSNTEELVGTECCPKTLVYDDNGVAKCCSMEGYEVKDGKCKEACPEERQCGDYCCQGDNVCNKETNECCNEALDYCCPSNQTATQDHGTNSCCSGTPFCQVQDYEGNCLWNSYNCCPEGGEVYLEQNNGIPVVYQCCLGEVFPGKGHFGNGSALCCSDGKTAKCATTDESGACLEYVCCSKNAEPYWAPWQRWWCD